MLSLAVDFTWTRRISHLSWLNLCVNSEAISTILKSILAGEGPLEAPIYSPIRLRTAASDIDYVDHSFGFFIHFHR